MTTAEGIRAAAKTLRALAAELSDIEQSQWSPHQHEAKGDWSASKTHTVHTVRNAGGQNVLIANSGQLAAFIGVMNPDLALALADWLEDEAAAMQSETGEPAAHAKVVAAAINASAVLGTEGL